MEDENKDNLTEDGIPMFTQETLKGISRSTLSEEYKPLINHKEKIDIIIK